MAGKGQKKSTGKSKVKVGRLQVNKETVKDLTKQEQKGVKGGGCYLGDTLTTCGSVGCKKLK